MIPEAFRRCGRNRGDETDSDGRAEAVPATGSRRSARGMLRGVRGRFIHSVELCTRPSYRNSAAGTFFCLSGPACGGCRRKRGRSLSLGCLVFVRSPSPRPPGCPRTRSGPHVCRSVCSRRSGLLPGRDSDTVARRFFCLGPGAWYTICDTLGIELKEALWKIPKPESNPLIQTRCTIIARS